MSDKYTIHTTPSPAADTPGTVAQYSGSTDSNSL